MTVPLVISVATFVWIFRLIDGFVGPFYDAWLQRMPQLGITHAPGLGILTTALFVLLVGAFATNVIGKRLLQTTEGYLLRVPVLRTIYAPVKKVVAFSPDNGTGSNASCWSTCPGVRPGLSDEGIHRGPWPGTEPMTPGMSRRITCISAMSSLRAGQGVLPGRRSNRAFAYPDRRHGPGKGSGAARRRRASAIFACNQPPATKSPFNTA